MYSAKANNGNATPSGFEASKTGELSAKSYLPITDEINLYPYYDFSYFIKDEENLKIYNYLDSSFTPVEVPQNLFI